MQRLAINSISYYWSTYFPCILCTLSLKNQFHMNECPCILCTLQGPPRPRPLLHQPVFKKLTLADLNSLRQRGYQTSVKKWFFDDPFHKKGLVSILWVLGMIQTSGSVIFLMKWGCWGHWGHWGCWGCRGLWGFKGSKAWKITTDDCSIIQVPEFSFILMFWKQIFFVRIMK